MAYDPARYDSESNQEYNPYNYPPHRISSPVRRMSSGFEQGEFTPGAMPLDSNPRSRSAKVLKDYRYGHQGNLCTKGGRVRCIGRICCCSLMTTVFLIVSIVLALALWIRPPSITIGSVQPQLGSGSQTTGSGLSIELGVNITVVNPNYFAVDLTKIEAELFYPIGEVPVGGGNLTNIVFKPRSLTTFIFPLVLSYNSNLLSDPVVKDLAAKCSSKSNLVINYKINLGIRFLIATISPVISNSFSFACPITASEIAQLLGGTQ